jgi:hydroxymethylpyrimidine/phosphomethylpyrimidine kinase
MINPILCIGQSDSCAGTGIQADIKTIQAFGGYAATVITAVTVQNTTGVFATHYIPQIIVKNQIERVMEDLNPQVIKTGMLADVSVINMLGDILDKKDIGYDTIKVIIDPVMTSRAGLSMLDKEARDAIKRRLLIHADVLTPNIEEAMALSGMEIKDVDQMCHAAETLRTLGAKAVVLKGGAIAADIVYDVLSDDNGTEIYQNPKQNTKSTHGAGTTLSAGLAYNLSIGLDIHDAYAKARAFVNKAIDAATPLGAGYGPLNHTVKPD